MLAALALHAAAIGALLSYGPARNALLDAAPIMVDLITAPRVETRPAPPTEVQKPKPMAKSAPLRLESAPVLTLPAEASSPVTAPPAPPAPNEVVAPPAPVPVLAQPIFDADYLDNPAPAYPPLARRLGEQGRVILRVLVNVRGGADDIQVRTSSGHARLDDTARDTVRRWRFVPAKRGAEPVPAWVLIPISFRLEG